MDGESPLNPPGVGRGAFGEFIPLPASKIQGSGHGRAKRTRKSPHLAGWWGRVEV